MSRVAAPADKRFRRAHVKPARRRGSWRTMAKPLARTVTVVLLLGLGLYRTSRAAAQAPILKVDRIQVRGNERLAKDDVLAVLSGLRGESLIWTDLDEWRERLLASPWVRDAALRRSLPSTVEVVIVERTPVGIGRIDGEMYLVDEGGAIIDRYGPKYADFDLPIIDGLKVRSRDNTVRADAERARLAARLIASLAAKPQVARRLSQIDVADLHNARVILNGDAAVIQLGEDQFLRRIESYLDLAATLRERITEIDSVDLRFDDRIYVQPAGAAGRKRETLERKVR